ncbi:MAG TPA: hypothetical protein VKT29_11640 [Terriglobales bacterium]|nr:hypothetical protein [Terriglobales bacterium]
MRNGAAQIKALLALFVVPLLVLGAVAQQGAVPALQGSMVDGMGLPGQAWTTMGNLSPIEHNNGYFQTYVEQDAEIFGNYSGSLTLSPYVSTGLDFDTKGYDWNNKIEPRAGLKLNKFFANGVVSLGTAYAYENRFKSFQSSGVVVYAEDWFGWQSVADKANRFPGSSWAAVGNLFPVEHGNWIGQVYGSQGIVAKRFGAAALVPYGETTFSRDTKKFDWDNKVIYGSGVKAVFTHGAEYTEVGAAYLRESRFYSRQSAGGLSVFINFSFSWNLLGRKAGT